MNEGRAPVPGAGARGRLRWMRQRLDELRREVDRTGPLFNNLDRLTYGDKNAFKSWSAFNKA